MSNKKKILLLGDDLRHHSGVATISKEIVLHTVDKYDWVQIGALTNHPDAGKILDICESVQQETGVKDAYLKIIPSDGYGNIVLLRQVIELEKPDAIMIFTDPRYWVWLFEIEHEIRAKMPIMYLNIWDDLPYPMWNKPYYESCDALFAISKQTKNVNEQVLGKEAENKIIRYIPHGVSMQYFPIESAENMKEYVEFRDKIRDSKDFVLLYNARNLGRKRVGDLVLAWRHFCDTIGKEKAKNCELILHTDIVDNSGTDLKAIYDDLCDHSYVNVKFVTDHFDTKGMNYLYNSADGVILISSNEGWGLSLTEALCTGKMIIATVTGGMQDQMRFEDESGNWINFTKTFPSNHTGIFTKCGEWAIPIFPKTRSLAGSPVTPYIYDDKTTIEDISDAILKLYSMSPEERVSKGAKGREWAIGDEAGFTAEKMGERFKEGIEATFENFKKYPRKKYTLTKIEDRPSKYINYDPINYSL